jgi:hypothetical protein
MYTYDKTVCFGGKYEKIVSCLLDGQLNFDVCFLIHAVDIFQDLFSNEIGFGDKN